MVRSRMLCEGSIASRELTCVLQEKLGCKVDSKCIVLPWLVRHAACVLSRFVKRDVGRTFLGRTDESDEVIVGTAVGVEFARSFRRRTRDKHWQRDAFTTFIGVPWNPRGLTVEAPMASSRRRYITRLSSVRGSFIAAQGSVARKIRAADQSKRD